MISILLRYAGPALAGLLLGFVLQGWRMGATISDLKAQHAAAITATVVQAQEETLRLQRIKDEAIEKANKLAQSNAVAADAARTERDRLRLQLSAESRKLREATRESLTDYTATLQVVFGECTAELTDLARKADGHALDARTLKDAWGETK
jgi:site-specific recombinase